MAPWDWAALVSIPAFTALGSALGEARPSVTAASTLVALALAWAIVRLDLLWAWLTALAGAAGVAGVALLTSQA